MWSIHCCVGVLLIFLLRHSAGSVEDRTRLYEDLFTGYQKNVAPDGPDSGAVVVLHSLIIERVVTLDNGILTLQAWEGMKWNDNRLSTEQYTGYASGDVHAIVNKNGNVTFMPPRITKTVCHFDENALYAEKEANCTMKYMSWTRDVQSLDLRLEAQPRMFYNTNPHWNVVNTSAVRNEHVYSCCPTPYVDVQYKLHLKRIK